MSDIWRGNLAEYTIHKTMLATRKTLEVWKVGTATAVASGEIISFDVDKYVFLLQTELLRDYCWFQGITHRMRKLPHTKIASIFQNMKCMFSRNSNYMLFVCIVDRYDSAKPTRIHYDKFPTYIMTPSVSSEPSLVQSLSAYTTTTPPEA